MRIVFCSVAKDIIFPWYGQHLLSGIAQLFLIKFIKLMRGEG